MKEQDDIRVTTGNIIYFEQEKDHWKMVDIFRPREPKNIFKRHYVSILLRFFT